MSTMLDRAILYVRWEDSSIIGSQMEPHEVPTPAMIETVGWVVADTDAYTTLALEIHDDHDLRCVVSIPASAIRERHALFTRATND